jgi:uncharacterized protein YdeI (YjbR/CyaY-like superfamily)
MNTTSVDSFLRDGCGRCEHYQTPQCKVLQWTAPLEALRALVRDAGLVEEMKWGAPAYTLGGKNVVMLGALKGSCAIGFFEGAALPDPSGLLVAPGPNSHHARQVHVRTAAEVEAHAPALRALIAAAIAHARSGAKRAPAPAEPVPPELDAVLDADPALRAAWDALTPGRRRSHVLHVGGAKQSDTRARRAEACAPKIRAGLGFLDR